MALGTHGAIPQPLIIRKVRPFAAAGSTACLTNGLLALPFPMFASNALL